MLLNSGALKGIKRNTQWPELYNNGVAVREMNREPCFEASKVPCLQIHFYLTLFGLKQLVLLVISENQADLHAGQQESNQNAGTKDKINAGDSEKEDDSAQDCFELPIWHSYSSTNTSASRSDNKRGGPREEEQVFLDDLARLQRQENKLMRRLKLSGRILNKKLRTCIPVSTASPNEGLSLSDTTNSQEYDSEIPPLEDIHQDTTDDIFTHYLMMMRVIILMRSNSASNRSKVNKSSEAHAFKLLEEWKAELMLCKKNVAVEIQKSLDLVDLPYWKRLSVQSGCTEIRRMKEEWLSGTKLDWLLWDTGKRKETFMQVNKNLTKIQAQKTKLMLGILKKKMNLIKTDVKSAFLYGKIDEEVYVSQPPGFQNPKSPEKVYKVVKALYGLHQAPRAWYATLSTFLLKNGYRRGTIDKTLFLKKDKHDIILVQVYVDDIIFGSTKKSCQDKYVAKILKKFDFASVKTASTPIETQKPLVKDWILNVCDCF
ncbi:putative ribonuclease H-like domain-containing protein [Tanacetum coccineum]